MLTNSTQRQPGIDVPPWGWGLLFLAALLLLGASLWAYSSGRQLAAQWEITSPQFESNDDPVAVVPNTQDIPAVVTTAVPESPPFISGAALQPWAGSERVTVLVLGIDQRCDEDGPTRTDSMMVATLDPLGKSGAILSLPRDLWVEIPGFGVDRVNQAHYLGEVYDYPGGGGPVLAMETVATMLGVPIDYYMTINFDAFIEVVDQIGGIDIEVPETIDDPDYPDSCYGFDPFHIEAGTHHLDGATALKYARTRATFGGDIDRAQRQQQVLLAVRDRLTQLGMIPQLVTRSPDLWQTLQENIRTNLALDKAIQLALLLPDIPRENIRSDVVNYDNVYDVTTPGGQQVLVPIRDNIRALRDDLFAAPEVPRPTYDDLTVKMREEQAHIALLNGTPVFGLAAATRDYLEELGFTVSEIGNADEATVARTRVIDYGSHHFTTRYLTQLMSIPPLNIRRGTSPDGDYDLLIIIGNDWSVPTD